MASRNLLTLRLELDEQTKEIQKLQKEVEQATQRTISQLSLSNHETCHKNPSHDGATIPKLSLVSSFSAPLQAFALKRPLNGGQTKLDQEGSDIKYSVIQNGWDGSSCPMDEHHLKAFPGKSSFLVGDGKKKPDYTSSLVQQHNLRQSINELNSKVQELLNKSTKNGIRCNELKGQEEANNQGRIQELETANLVQEEMLKQAHAYIDILKEMLQKRDQVYQDIQRAILEYGERSGTKMFQEVDLGNLGTVVVKIYQELADEASSLKTKLLNTEDHLDILKKQFQDKEDNLKQCQEKCDNFHNEHEQQVAVLSLELKDAKSQAKKMQNELEVIKQQNTKHEDHVTNLECVVSQLRSELKSCKKTNKDKVEELKKQLSVANASLEKAQHEQSQCSQDFAKQLTQLNEALKMYEKQLDLEKKQYKQLQEKENANRLTNENLKRELMERTVTVEQLQVMVNKIKEDNDQKEEEQLKTIQEKTAGLNFASCQLEYMKTTLQKMTEELTVKALSLENAEKNAKNLKVHLAEKDKALNDAVNELGKLRSYAEAKKREVHELQSASEQLSEMLEDTETLKLLLAEKDNMIMTLREQIETLTRVVGQQNQKVGSLEEEKSQLLAEASHRSSLIQDTMAMAEKKEARINELEEMCCVLNLEKTKLTNECIEKACVAKKLKKEKEEIAAELRGTQNELARLSEDLETLRRNYQNQKGESETTTAILKIQLKATVAELAQAKNTLRTAEGCDGHAMKIASRMQKKITAKREQIDSLQSRIQFLEEALSDATKEKQNIKLENTKLMKQYSIKAAEKNKLSVAAESLKCENTALKGNVANTEATLDKTLFQLAECQAVIQCLEQEIMRLRLQHTLDLKELKGLTPADLSTRPTHVMSPVSFPHPSDVAISHSKAARVLEPSAKSNVMESSAVINLSESSPCMPFKDEAPLKLSKETLQTSVCFSNDPLTLHTADLEDKGRSMSFSNSANHVSVAPCYTSSPKKHFTSQVKPRSPVHSLLTAPASDIDTYSAQDKNLCTDHSSTDSFIYGENHKQLTNDTCQILQHRLEYLQGIAEDLQMRNKETSFIIGIMKNSEELEGNKGNDPILCATLQTCS
ncbi:coiled-coil domain-containing protein 158 [Gastrophryne carolinensis]